MDTARTLAINGDRISGDAVRAQNGWDICFNRSVFF